MASVLIKNLPDDLHRALKQRAERHHRSLNKEIIALIESALTGQAGKEPPQPAGLRRPLAQEVLDEARQKKAARVLALRGKYRNSVSSSEEFAARKAAEIELER